MTVQCGGALRGGEELVPGPGEKGGEARMFQAEQRARQGVEMKESQITGFVCANTVWPESLSKPTGMARTEG